MTNNEYDTTSEMPEWMQEQVAEQDGDAGAPEVQTKAADLQGAIEAALRLTRKEAA